MTRSSTRSSIRMTAEERFTATQKKDKQAMSDREKERQALTDKIARQKALRLAKEAADQDAAAIGAAKKTTAKKKSPESA